MIKQTPTHRRRVGTESVCGYQAQTHRSRQLGELHDSTLDILPTVHATVLLILQMTD